MKKITIAIDGYSSTGKSTVSKQLAKKLNYIYVDSGAMYRAITLFALKNNIIGKDYFSLDKLIQNLDSIHLKFKFNSNLGFAEMFLNDKNVENEIRTLKVSNFVSKISEISEVRKRLVSQQQVMGKDKGVVMDGRDIGTVVFPKAELKIFMIASASTRAKRRYDELIKKGENVLYKDVLKNIEDRDLLDTNRKDSPLVKANDAILFDNSQLTREERLILIYEMSLKKINS